MCKDFRVGREEPTEGFEVEGAVCAEGAEVTGRKDEQMVLGACGSDNKSPTREEVVKVGYISKKELTGLPEALVG